MAQKEIQVAVASRETTGTRGCGRMRRGGAVPAVVYGHGVPNRNVQLDGHTAITLARHPGLVSLRFDGAAEPHLAVLRGVQRHPVTGAVLHLDFREVRRDEKMTMAVPLRPLGTPKGLSLGGVLDQVMYEVDVRCLPAHLPEELTADVSGLELNQHITLDQVPLPEGVELHMANPHAVAFHVKPPMVEKAPTPAEALLGADGAPLEGAPGEAAPADAAKAPEAKGGKGGK